MATTTATGSRFDTTREVPPHLKPYVAEQHYDMYTAIDQAVWRFIMKIAATYYGDQAHSKYVHGMHETGMSPERVPRVGEMDEKLQRFGWRAVPIVGFIPPAAFLEFQGYGLLGIACDIRQLKNVSYTPAPDIVHEAAGHAPILADQDYADFVRSYGQVAAKAIFSKANMDEYYAIRRLSDLKENPASTQAQIDAAQKELQEVLSRHSYDSEVDWVTRFGWWTTEFGLVGGMEKPQLFGAGLLSSIGEGLWALTGKEDPGPADGKPHVIDGKKYPKLIPLTIDCIDRDFDITDMQPQYYLARDFDHLYSVLDELADKLSFRRGGVHGLGVAKKGQTVVTVELDSGMQVGGVLTEYRLDEQGRPSFIKFGGEPAQIAFNGEQLEGHGAIYHSHGYSSPIGPLKDGRTLNQWSRADFEAAGFVGDQQGTLEYASGITVTGTLKKITECGGEPGVLLLQPATVKQGDEVLYSPDWGPFDLVCGGEITSVYGGAPDRYAYLAETKGADFKDTAAQSSNLTDENRALNELYAAVRKIREAGTAADKRAELDGVLAKLDAEHPKDWLLRWELLELNKEYELDAEWAAATHTKVAELAETNEIDGPNIKRGLDLV